MGWEDRHLHIFEILGERYGIPDLEFEEEERDLDEDGVRVHLLLDEGDHFTYEHDFGDSWVHDINVEAVDDVTLPLSQAICLDGAGACPQEDCGGAPGYEDFVEIMGDPSHDGHQDMVERFGRLFDPEYFSLSEANARMQQIR